MDTEGKERVGQTEGVALTYRAGDGDPTPALSPGESHGRRSLVGCRARECNVSDTTERVHTHLLHLFSKSDNPSRKVMATLGSSLLTLCHHLESHFSQRGCSCELGLEGFFQKRKPPFGK